MTAASQARVVFVSYAREDDGLRTRLEVVLTPLVRSGRLELWADHRIGVSRSWRDEIERNLERAELAVLLVSADFLASAYINEVELPRLTERGVPLVCVPVAPCGWHVVEPLERVQWALPPERGLSTMTRDECDAALMDVFKTLEALAVELDRAHGPGSQPPADTPRRAGSLTPSAPGPLRGVPALPRTYHLRAADLRALKERLAATADIGLVGGRAATGLQGRGGVGKSVLAAAACHDDEVRSWFPDGVCWVTLGERPDLVTHQRELAARFGWEPTFVTPREGARELGRLLADARCLLVIDDVWSTAAAEAFAVTGPSGRVLYTTREAAVLSDVGAAALVIDLLSPADSLRFLERAGGPVSPADRRTVDRAVEYTGGSILALSLVAAAVRNGRGWREVTVQLEALAKVFSDHPYADAFRSMRLAVEGLAPVDADRYRLLGVFPEDVGVPEQTVARLWGVDNAAPTLTRLLDADLITLGDGRVSLQDLKRAFVIFNSDQPWSLAHRQLLDAHWSAQSWSRLPTSEPYLWEHLLYHLERAGDYRTMVGVVTDASWLARRVHRGGPHAAERDVARAHSAAPDDPDVGATLRLLRLWPELFGRGLSLAATTATLIARLPRAEASAGTLTGDVWLQPARALIEPPEALLRTLVGHESAVAAIAFAADGAMIATAGDDGTVRLWNVGNHHHVRTVAVPATSVTAVAFSSTGSNMATASTDGLVRIWDPATGELGLTLHGHRGAVNALAYTSDGAMLATAGDDGTIRVWNARTGEERFALDDWVGAVIAVAFAPGGSLLAAGGSDGAVCLQDPLVGAAARIVTLHSGWATAVAFSPDGRTLATADSDGNVHLLDVIGDAPERRLTGHTDWINALAFAPDGSALVTCGDDGVIRLWDAATGEPGGALSGHAGPVTGVAFTPDGATLATAGEDGTARLWDPTASSSPPLAIGRRAVVNALAFAPDAATIATAGEDGAARLLDAAGTKRRTLIGHNGAVNSVAFVPDGTILITGSDDGSVRFWDVATGDQRRALTGHTGRVTAVAVAPGGDTLATASSDATIRLWDVATGRLRGGLTGHTDWVTGLAFAPDGRTLATSSSDGTVRVWDILDGSLHNEIHGGPFSAIAFAHDGGSLVTAGADGVVRLCEPYAGDRCAVLPGHPSAVNSVAVGPDGNLLAVAGDDGTVRLWDTGALNELAALRLGATVACVAFAPDGRSIAAGMDCEVVDLRIRTRHRARQE
jgi:WD40 repeat protein